MLKKIYGNFETKQQGEKEDRVIRFIGTNETKDRDNDVIKVDGWETKNYLKNPVFLAMHDYRTLPVGKTINLETKGKGLVFDVKFPSVEEISDVNNPSEHAKFVETIYKMYLNKYLNAVSVGFDPSEWTEGKDERGYGYKFTKQDLLELSAVPVPSNPEALQQAKTNGIVDQDQIKLFTKEITKDKGFDTFLKNEEGNELDLEKTNQEIASLKEQIKSLSDSFAEYKEISKVGLTKEDLESCVAILKTDINEEVKKTLKKSTEEIPLDDIDYVEEEKNTEKDDEKKELEIKPDELKSIIKEAVKEEIEKAKGEI